VKDAQGRLVSVELPSTFVNSLQPSDASQVFTFIQSAQLANSVLKGDAKPPTAAGYGSLVAQPSLRPRVTAAGVASSYPFPTGDATQAANSANGLLTSLDNYCAGLLAEAQADLQTVQTNLKAAQAYLTTGSGFANQAEADWKASNYNQCISDAQQALFYLGLVDNCMSLANNAYADLGKMAYDASQGDFGIACSNQAAINDLLSQAQNSIVNGSIWTSGIEQNCQQLIQQSQQQGQQAQLIAQLVAMGGVGGQIQHCMQTEFQWWGEVDIVLDENCTRILEQYLNIVWSNQLIGTGGSLLAATMAAAAGLTALATAGVGLIVLGLFAEVALVAQDIWLADTANHNGVTLHFSFAPWLVPFELGVGLAGVVDLPTLLGELVDPGLGT
jgi:hypothetical protein